MLRKILFTLGIAIFTCGYAYSQNATIKGRVVDEKGSPIEDAIVRLLQEGQLILGVKTDKHGDFSLTPVPSGDFKLNVTYPTYPAYEEDVSGIRGSITRVLDEIQMKKDQVLKPHTVKGKPIFEPDQVKKEDYYSPEDIKNVVGRTVEDIISKSGGVTVSASGQISVRAGRDEPTYYMDGIPTSSVPNSAIRGLSLISGSIPAEYGDASAIIEIETKGPSRNVSGEVSLYTDGYNNVTVEGVSTGPIIKAKTDDGTGFSMGYMLSFSAGYSQGPIYWKGYHRASKETIDYLKQNPFLPTEELSSQVVNYSPDHVTKYQEGNILSLEENRARQAQNAWSTSVNIRPKIDIRTPANIDLSLGGRFTYATGRSFSFANSLFNSENNPMSENMSWEVNARFTHRLGSAESKSIIKNAYYRLIGYYIHSSSTTFSSVHKDNFFDYGYIGEFTHVKTPYYETGTFTDPNTGTVWENTRIMSTFENVAVMFTPSDKNSALAQYTVSAFERAGGFLPNDEYIQTYRGLLNGNAPSAAYGLFTAPGMPHSGYAKSLSDRMGGKALVSFEIKNHAIRFGFDYDQSIGHSYSIAPMGLWTIMRQLANSHIMEMDTTRPDIKYDENGVFMGIVDYPRYVNKEAQKTFDKNIREKLGKGEDEWIDIDSYKPEDYMGYGSLDLFSAEELFNNGNSLVSYQGFDYTGKKTTNRSITMANMQNWFNEGDPDNKRDFSVIGASKPVKMAVYLQDKFSIKTLYIQLGLRMDIFNVNQPYVKDMYLYRDAYTVKEAQAGTKLSSETFIPDFMRNSDDYVVYVKDPTASTVEITAFRNGKNWYDKDGNPVTDPTTIAKMENVNNLTPFLKSTPGESEISRVNYRAFADYTPTFANGGITLSPRIAFSFAVGEKSVFSASYNVMTLWSSAVQGISPVRYLYFEKYATSNTVFTNPGLKPERNVNYEIGFKQMVTNDMSMGFTAYYSERRDQIVLYQYMQAYPVTYLSYTNMDFGTVQGFIFDLNMRATKQISFRANYTLQFAKGTGSDPGSTLNLLVSGQPNLRTLTVLNDDQRHKINLIVSYAYGPGDGPTSKRQTKSGKVKETKWLQNAGISINLGAGSGLPYTRSSKVYSTIVGQGARSVEGAINGARMPWTIDGDIQIRKGFLVTLKKSENLQERKTGILQFALAIKNVVGYKNVRSVYSYTGSRMDDGFLTSRDFEQYISQQENVASFIDYYTIVMEGLNPFGAPRKFELQVSLSF